MISGGGKAAKRVDHQGRSTTGAANSCDLATASTKHRWGFIAMTAGEKRGTAAWSGVCVCVSQVFVHQRAK